MKPIVMIATFGWFVLWSATSIADEPVRVRDLSGNVKARLVGAKIGQGRAVLLIAKFETLDRKREIQVVFPAHSSTTHEATLKAVVLACSDWGEAPDQSQWGRVTGEAIFSVPKNGAHFVPTRGEKSLDHCYVVSLKLEASK